MEVCAKSRLSLAATSAYSLRMLWAFHWSLGSHSLYPQRLTFPRTSGYRWGSLTLTGETQGSAGLPFSGDSGPLVQLTSGSSLCSLTGRSLPVLLSNSPSGTFSVVCSLPVTILRGIWTSWAYKFLNTLPMCLEPGQRSPYVLVAMTPTWPKWQAMGSAIFLHPTTSNM